MKVHWPWVILAYSSLFVFGLTDNLRGPIFPELLNHYQVNNSIGSLFFAVSSMMTTLGAFFVPRIIDRFGHLNTLLMFMVMLLISQIGYYIAPDFAWVLFFCIPFGLAIGGLSVTQNLLVLISTPAERRQQIQSGLHACYGASSLIAPLLVIGTSLNGRDWRFNFAELAFLIFIFLCYLLAARRKALTVNTSEDLLPSSLYVRKEAWYVATILAIYVALEILVSSRLALFMRLEKSVDLRESSSWVSLFFAGLFAGRMLLSVYRPPFSISSQLKASLLGTTILIILSIISAPEWLALTGVTLAPFYPLTMTAMSLLFRKNVDKAAAVAVALSGVSVVGMHAAVGVLSDLYGLKIAFVLGVLLAMIAFAMILLHKKYFGRVIP